MTNNERENAIKNALNRVRKNPYRSNTHEQATLKRYIKIIARYIKENYTRENVNEAPDDILGFLDKMNSEYCEMGAIVDDYVTYQDVKLVLENPAEIQDIIERIKSGKVVEQDYKIEDFNIAKELEKIKQSYANAYIDIKRANDIRKELALKGRTVQGMALDFSNETDEKNAKILTQSMEEYERDLNGIIREKLIKTLKSIFEFFDKFNLFPIYEQAYNTNMANNGYYDLKLNLLTDKKTSFEEVFTDEVLEKLSFDQLIALNLFYQNRFAKEVANVGEAIFAIDTLNLGRGILDTKSDKGLIKYVDETVKQDEVNAVKNKTRYLDEVVTILLKDLNKGNYNYDEALDRAIISQGPSYEDLFYKMLPYMATSAEKDFIDWDLIHTAVLNIYLTKNHLLDAVIAHKTQDVHGENFGIIRDNRGADNKVLIGLDAEGFNLPIRLHIKKESFARMLQANNGSTHIREYKGSEDFDRFPANIILPVTREYWQKILELEKNARTPKEKNFYSHLRYIMKHKKYPVHFGKKSDVTYIDVNTGQVCDPDIDIEDGDK